PVPARVNSSARCRASRLTPREQTPAEEGPFQRAVAVHTAAAEAARFAGREEPPDDSAVGSQRATIKIGLDATERLAGEHMQLDRDQGTGSRILQAMRCRGA